MTLPSENIRMMFEVRRGPDDRLIWMGPPREGDYFRVNLSGKTRGKIGWDGRQKGDRVIVWDGNGNHIGAFRVRGNQVPRR